MNYRDTKGRRQPIDNTLTADTASGNTARNGANRYQVELPANLASAPIKVTGGGNWIGFQFPPIATKAAAATYAGALLGVNWTYAAGADSAEESLVLASAAAPTTFRFAVTASAGVNLAAQEGAIAVSQGAKALGLLEAPYMADTAGASGPVSMTLTPAAGGGP